MTISVESSGKCVKHGANAQATRFLALMAAAVLAMSSACNSTAAPPMAVGGAPAPGGAATFTDVLAIFADPKNNCALCHAMATIGGGLIFNPTDRQATFQALVGVISKGLSGSQCGGKTYVVPGQPDASLLYNKLATATPPCGMRMPASGTVLSAMEIATVRAWIAAGASND